MLIGRIALALVAWPLLAHSHDSSTIDEPLVSIAAGVTQPLRVAPAVVTVITAEDVQSLGANDLDQVLETVPGLHVSRSPVIYGPIYVIRGIRGTLLNPEVLMLVNGVALTAAYGGDRGSVWGGWPIEDIARIEILRGPGSALYGADAFAGVVNIITKTAADISGTQGGVRWGAYSTRDAWLLHGARYGPVDVAAYLSVGHTRGSRPTIAADAQTGLDRLGATAVSLAPGPASNGHDLLDVSLDLSSGPWRARAAYATRSLGSGAGVAQALDPTGRSTSQRITADLTYENPAFTRDWALTVQASAMRYVEHSDLVLFPPGANLGAGSFSEGVIGNPSKYERHLRLSASATYIGWPSHRVRLGLGHEVQSLYKIAESKNFNPDFSPIGIGSIHDVVDVTDTVPFIHPHTRVVRYAYLQDEWSLASDWTLTTGIRQDLYSDFGSTTNPRAALVWNAAYNVTAKLLYGSAFRAPSFLESYLINNPALIGNPDLKPETIKTLEAVVSWQASPALQWNVNLFRYEIASIIRVDSAGQYQNGGRQRGTGLSLVGSWDASPTLHLAGQVSLQHAVDGATHADVGMAPHTLSRLHATWQFASTWQLGALVNAVGPSRRVAGDLRPPLAGYTTLDLSLLHHDTAGSWAVTATVRNVLNADAREPSPFGQPFTQLPHDLPLGGRSFLIEARHPF